MRGMRTRAVAVGLALVAALAGAGTVSACPYYGAGINCGATGSGPCPWFIGGYEDPPSTPVQVESYITYDNPSPVFQTSSIWNMLTTYGGTNGNFAQTGWIHYNGSSLPWVFWEDCPSSGNCNPPQLAMVNPAGETQYFETQWLNPGFAFWWNENYAVDTSVNFTPEKIQFYGEIHNYKSASPTDLGDHSPGNTSTQVHVYDMAWLDRNFNAHSANLTYDYNSSYHPSAPYQEAFEGGSGNEFYTDDSRYNCNY